MTSSLDSSDRPDHETDMSDGSPVPGVAEMRSMLIDLATDLRWTWDREMIDVLSPVATDEHPLVALRALDDERIAVLMKDRSWCASVIERHGALVVERSARPDPEIAYYSPEFGISEHLPQYSGGLGVLAGDHLKAASDLAVPLVAVGLFYRHGFFRQTVVDGVQHEHHDTVAPEDLGGVDTGVVVDVSIGGHTVRVRVWRFEVGRVPLLMLDTDHPDNSDADRAITDRLYSGDRQHRLRQELVLGIGGARAVAALGYTPLVHHLNEGHAGFSTLELLARERGAGVPMAEAIDRVRRQVLFTTHTPVPAGIDRFDPGMVEAAIGPWLADWGVGYDEIAVLAADADGEPPHGFNMAALCLRMSDRANGVSRLHGETSRRLFAAVSGGAEIGSITNGVHARTWTHRSMQDLFDRRLGATWDAGDVEAWSKVDALDDESLIDVRRVTRRDLVRLVAERSGHRIDDDALVIGFARRFATYKRATLMLRHVELLAQLLGDSEHPVHVVMAGKAHPADGEGKALLAEVVAFTGTPLAAGRFSFVSDYDMGVARAMYAGSDVWLNTPVRPYEASGTSGEKAALNGALNCSIRDGWWAEMSDGRNGWDIPTATDEAYHDGWRRDDDESRHTLAVLAAIAAEFHADGRGRPSAAWLDRMRYAWRTLGPRVTAARMVDDYREVFYRPMAGSWSRSSVSGR